MLQVVGSTMPHAQLMRSIELYGTKVAPEVRKALAERAGADPETAGGGGEGSPGRQSQTGR
jgi:hypothetical protein